MSPIGLPTFSGSPFGSSPFTKGTIAFIEPELKTSSILERVLAPYTFPNNNLFLKSYTALSTAAVPAVKA